ATHLQKVGEPLVKAFGDTPPYAIFSDSLEAYGADWTPTLPAEFQKRRGYDLLPHLPELVAGGTPAAEKVRHDWGQTLTELVNENYLTQINNWAIAHHTKFRSQTYGEPAVSFSSQRLATLPEGEGPQWRTFSTLRWATSANHVFHNNVSSGETFTWLHSPVFRATALDMKAEADIDFIMGENQLIFHGWPYSPPDHKVSEPGWSLYAAAVFNDHNPWHPVMPDVTRYIQRISWLLRQGEPANQVAILLPTDDAWASFTPSHVTVTGAMQKLIAPALMSAILNAGYNVDYIDADAINSVGLGTHQILVIPPTDRIPVKTLKKIVAWSEHGGKVIGVDHIPTRDPEGNPASEITELSKTIMLVPNTAELTKALDNVGNPDFKLTGFSEHVKEPFGFIRRKLPNVDVYFVTNTSNRSVDATATFATAYQYGEQWDPDSVSSIPIPSANLSVSFNPYESKIFVFSSTAPKPSPEFLEYNDQMNKLSAKGYVAAPLKHVPQTRLLADLSADWQVNFTATKETETEPTLTDWTTNPATLYYSGEGVYAHDFTLATTPKSPVFLEIEGGQSLPGPSPNSPPEHPVLGSNGLPDPRITRTGPGMHAYYDPPIHEAAIIFLNGQRAGSLWHPPYRLDVSKFLKPGENHIEIRVYNTALNAWSKLPPHDYKPLIEKYGDRFQMQDLDKVQPIPSGILGTIHLVTEATQ
ncbi:MAG TPA: glycosyl hydrolase, partial [Edaphobacter sp.]|nr:glycosyl hydrolase [Edaphobacter sp.]